MEDDVREGVLIIRGVVSMDEGTASELLEDEGLRSVEGAGEEWLRREEEFVEEV